VPQAIAGATARTRVIWVDVAKCTAVPYTLPGMRRRYVLQLLVLAFLLIDLSNPFVPGVFSLEANQLYIDGALRLTHGGLAQPLPATRTAFSRGVIEHTCLGGEHAAPPQARARPRFLTHVDRRGLFDACDSTSSTDPH
jgi:hypothetical protein